MIFRIFYLSKVTWSAFLLKVPSFFVGEYVKVRNKVKFGEIVWKHLSMIGDAVNGECSAHNRHMWRNFIKKVWLQVPGP